MTGPHGRPWLARVETANSLFLAAFFLFSFHSLHQEHFATPFFLPFAWDGWYVPSCWVSPRIHEQTTRLSEALPVRRKCIERTIGIGGPLRQTFLRPQLSRLRLRGGCVGKFSRSWQLVMQSFAILRSDKQLMLFPVFSAISCFILTAIIATGGAFLLLPARAAALAAGEQFHPNQSPMFMFGMFTLYVVNYFVIVFFNVALVGVANSRLMGGTWTFRDGIELA